MAQQSIFFKKTYILISLLGGLLLTLSSFTHQQPYPSGNIRLSFDWLGYDSSRDRLALGSDNFPITWADDGNQYTSWGDGGGFDGTNSDGRVSLGIARVSGGSDKYSAVNVFGGKDAANPATFSGKSYGLIGIGSMLYMWVSPGSNAVSYDEARIYASSDYGASWEAANWAFVKSDGIIFPTFLQFGRGYMGARDNYVYIYANNLKVASRLSIHKPGEIILARVLKDSIMDRSKYEFFMGKDTSNNPIWTSVLANRKPVFENPEGIGWNSSVSYNSGLKRYFLITEHQQTLHNNIGIFDSPNPWGPWTTTLYDDNFGAGKIPDGTFFFNFSNKWASVDGKKFVLIFTGIGDLDSWNIVKGTFSFEIEKSQCAGSIIIAK